MVDCIGSISKYIDQTEENIEFIVNGIKKEFGNSEDWISGLLRP